MLKFIGAALLLLLAVDARAADHQAAANALDAAIVAKDRATLGQLIAEDFLWVRGRGATGDKAAFIAALTAPTLTIEPFRPSDTRWLLSGDSAMLTGANAMRGTEDGKPFTDRHRFADYWVRRDGRWRLVYIQVTSIPD